jgi:uncharacterized membrane protein YcaP (DUF421 family)
LGLEAGIGMIIALSIINYLIDYLTFKSKHFRKLLDGKPITIIKDGELLTSVLHKQRISNDDVLRFIRQNGLEALKMSNWGVMEIDGTISIIAKKNLK